MDPVDRWTTYPLRAYPSLWRRTHRDVVFALDPSRVRGRLGFSHPFAPLMGWVTPEDRIEGRYVMAGLTGSRAWRAERVQLAIRRGQAGGYVIGSNLEQAPHVVFAPSTARCHFLGIPIPRIKESAIDHGQLAIEAALVRLAHRGELDALAAIRSESDLVSSLRRGIDTARARSTKQPATADLEVMTTAGRRYWIEVLSDNYDNDDVEAKYLGLDVPVDMVATSRTVAARAIRVMPHVTCFHF